MASLYDPDCERARELLVEKQEIPQSNHQPRGSTSYFPRSAIIKALKEVSVRGVFTCSCGRCRHHAEVRPGVDDRGMRLDEAELLGQYATVYGLLIYLRYPGLISGFLRKEYSLDKGYFSAEDLKKILDKHSTLTTRQTLIICDEILESQYRFRVRKFSARKAITDIHENEILPIIENHDPAGKGDFGEVYEFTIHEEYVDENLKSRQIKLFARKVFDRRWTQASAAKEWVHHLYANNLQHPNLMEALAAYDHGNYFFIVSELAQTTLWGYLLGISEVVFSPEELWNQVHGLTSGLAYLHGQRVKGERWENGKMYHMDLKPSNILIVKNVMKIADFGLSKYKPDPYPTESRLTGDSRHEGVGIYAPPSGRVNEGWDVYSLGAIMSEIASFDIDKTPRVKQYRAKRGRDTLNGQEFGSMQFFYRETDNLKQSVIQEHVDLVKIMKDRGDISGTTRLRSWQEQFYQKEFFDEVEEMLQQSSDARPTASKIAKQLKARIKTASTAFETSPEGGVDIWGQTVKGTVVANPSPPKEADRLIAYLGDKRCGLWLYSNVKDEKVEIRQFLSDDRVVQERVMDFDRSKPRSSKLIQMLYVNSDAKDSPVSLTSSQNESACIYRFPHRSQALRFQAIMTGNHVYKDMSLEVTKFIYLKKHLWSSSRANKNKYSEKECVQSPAHLQLWTNCEVDEKSRSPNSLEMRLVILMETRLDLIDVFSVKGPLKPLDEPTTENGNDAILQFGSVELGSLDVPKGLPLTLKGIEGSHCYTRTSHAGLRLYLEDTASITKFRNNLEALQEMKNRSRTQVLPPLMQSGVLG